MVPINIKNLIFFIAAGLAFTLFIVTGCGDSPEAGTPVDVADEAAEPHGTNMLNQAEIVVRIAE